jgi:hypothetical protein
VGVWNFFRPPGSAVEVGRSVRLVTVAVLVASVRVVRWTWQHWHWWWHWQRVESTVIGGAIGDDDADEDEEQPDQDECEDDPVLHVLTSLVMRCRLAVGCRGWRRRTGCMACR